MNSWSACTCVRDVWRDLQGYPFRDDPFTEADWQVHGTWRRYIPEPHVSGIVILSLAPVWGWSVLVSAGLGLYATYAEPAGWPNVSGHEQLITIFTLTSFALSLLMLFKTTSSYGRWWEARTLWGAGYIHVRSVLRLAISFVGRSRPDLLPAVYRWTAAVLPALAAQLRGRCHYVQDHLGPLLHPAELDWLLARGQGRGLPAIAALQVLSRLLDGAGLEVIERQQLEALLSQLDVVIGGCERIRAQPIPYAWNRHTHRFLLFYITFLPFAFWPLYQWYTLPISAVVAFLLCGVENIGVQIEEPHRVLPLNHICAGTLRALRLMMDDAQPSADMAQLAASFAGLASCDQLAVQLAPAAHQPQPKSMLRGAIPSSAGDALDNEAGHLHGPTNMAAADGQRSSGQGVPPARQVANGELAPP